MPLGACCTTAGVCYVLTEDSCDRSGWYYEGEGSVCDPSPCDQPGACCRDDGSCSPGARSLDVAYPFVYVAGTNTVFVVDLLAPAGPAVRGSFTKPATGMEIRAQGRCVVVSTSQGGYLLDVSDPDAPSLVTAFSCPKAPGIGVEDAILTGGSSGLQLFAIPCGLLAAVSTGPVASAHHGRIELTSSPSPFRDDLHVRLRSPLPGSASIAIFDMGGRRVRTLHEGPVPAGDATFAWDGRSERGAPVPSGWYAVVSRSGEERVTTRALRIR